MYNPQKQINVMKKNILIAIAAAMLTAGTTVCHAQTQHQHDQDDQHRKGRLAGAAACALLLHFSNILLFDRYHSKDPDVSSGEIYHLAEICDFHYSGKRAVMQLRNGNNFPENRGFYLQLRKFCNYSIIYKFFHI